MEALVDVLIPVRDAADTLGEALESVRRQTLRRFRVLVLDDGSADDSAGIAAGYAAADARFAVLRAPHRGLVAALNDLLGRAEAPYVARLDADDLMHPDRLAAQHAYLETHPGIDVVASRVEFFGGEISRDLRAYERWLNGTMTPEAIERDLFVEAPLPHPAVMMRTETVRAAGGYRDAGPEDYDLWLRLWRAGSRFGKLEAVLTRLRDHPRRLTRTDPRYSSRSLLECKAEHLVGGKGLAGGEIVVWGAGRDGIRTAKALRRRGAVLRHLVDIAETKLGRSMLGVRVLPPASLAIRPHPFVVAAVGHKGARALIRARLAEMGYGEGDGFVCFG